MFEWHDVAQNTEAWEALRLGKVTNSHAPTFMANLGKTFGEPAKAYALTVALEQLNGRKSINAGFTNAQMDRGHAQEHDGRVLYERETFSTVTNGGFFCWGAHGDSPDGLIGTKGALEIKSVIDKVHFANIQRGKFDPAYRWQLVGHLDCTGREWVDFASYCADFPEDSQLFIDRLNREDYAEDIKALRERRAELLSLVAEIKAEVMRHGGLIVADSHTPTAGARVALAA
jgi:hypothetical protein